MGLGVVMKQSWTTPNVGAVFQLLLTLTTHVHLLRTFVAQLIAATKICPQPRQNAEAQTKYLG